MRRAVILKHAEFEGPARLANVLIAEGYTLEVRALHRGDGVPATLSRQDLLIVMGGPMGVGDLDAPEYPFLRPEIELLAKRIAEDAPVLGICLGSQLLAFAAGEPVYPMTDRTDGRRLYEVGWSEIAFAAQRAAGSVLEGLPSTAPMMHWHGDTFDLPQGARRIASTSACANQAFQLGRRAFGLQFHCEVGTAEIEAFLHNDLDFAVRACGADAAEQIRDATRRHLDGMQRTGDRLLSNIVRAMQGEA